MTDARHDLIRRDLDPRLIRLMTRRYAELQGLTTATQALFIAAVCGIWLMTENAGATLLAAIVLLIPCVWAVMALDRFYADRFGRVTPDGAAQGWRVWAPICAASIVVTTFFPLGSQLAVLWLLIAIQAAWRIADGWPHRLQEGFVVAAALVATVEGGWTPSPTETAHGFLLIALACVISGIADHRLLHASMERLKRPA